MDGGAGGDSRGGGSDGVEGGVGLASELCSKCLTVMMHLEPEIILVDEMLAATSDEVPGMQVILPRSIVESAVCES